ESEGAFFVMLDHEHDGLAKVRISHVGLRDQESSLQALGFGRFAQLILHFAKSSKSPLAAGPLAGSLYWTNRHAKRFYFLSLAASTRCGLSYRGTSGCSR